MLRNVLVLAAAIAAPAVAQMAQPIDSAYTALIKRYLQDPRITTELVDHLPASATVPTPLKFHGRIVGTIGELTYSKDINRYLEAIAKAAGTKAGLRRYGHAYVPLDEALSRVVVDFSGRPGLEYHIPFTRSHIGTFDVDLTREFFRGLVNHALITMHIDNLRGFNSHHQAETVFKACGRALRMALEVDPRMGDVVPSTKGVL